MSPAPPTGLAVRRVPLLLLGAAALFAGGWAGLSRLGALPPGPASPMDHGALMVSGFLGTVIALERAVAARAPWAYAGPLACGAGAALLLAGLPGPGAVLLTAGSAVVVAVLAVVVRQDPALHHQVLALAAVSWLVGNALLVAGHPPFDAVPFWLAFLVGTIAAERLELNRVLPVRAGAKAAFLVGLALLVGGAVATQLDRLQGFRVLAAGELALAAWLLRHDVARRTVRQGGQTRFIAVALLSGYGWLAVGGALGLAFGNPLAGPVYDALLHAVLVGFVFSMIFGHALIILPAVLRVRVPYRPRFFGHLAVLHLSLLARLAGDLAGSAPLRTAGAWGNAAAILLFLGSTFFAAREAPPPRPLLPDRESFQSVVILKA